MIDIHSHILPGIDDGAQALDDALQLLRMAVKGGIKTQVLTPHMRSPRYINDPATIHKAFADFRDIVNAEGIPVALRLSAEVRIGEDVTRLVQREDFPWLGNWQGKQAFLLEMPHHQIPVGSLNLVKWLIQRNILPIIVHPERNREIKFNINKLGPFIKAGCKLQITAASLYGKFGEMARKTAIDLLRSDDVMLMATDCHNVKHRPPDLKSGFEIAAEIIGEVNARALVYDRPAQLLGIYANNRVLSA